MPDEQTCQISLSLYNRLRELGIIDSSDTREANAGTSDYSKHTIQPWSIWIDYKLNPFDADIVKRILRKKGNTHEEIRVNRKLDYQKIIHICKERLRQLDCNYETEKRQVEG